MKAEYEARGEEFNVFDEDLENYAFLDPSADLSSLITVTGLSEEEWKRAIGVRGADERDDSDSIEDSELSRCCADISRIRDLLIRTKVNGGLLPSDVTKLQQLLDSHEPTTQQEILKKIFGQLKVVWDENTTKDRGSH